MRVLLIFRSIYLLGMRGSERAQYWALLLWTIFGFHFRQVVELHVQ